MQYQRQRVILPLKLPQLSFKQTLPIHHAAYSHTRLDSPLAKSLCPGHEVQECCGVRGRRRHSRVRFAEHREARAAVHATRLDMLVVDILCIRRHSLFLNRILTRP